VVKELLKDAAFPLELLAFSTQFNDPYRPKVNHYFQTGRAGPDIPPVRHPQP